MTLVGEGFRLSPDEVTRLGFDLANLPAVIRPYLNGREVAQKSEGRFAIDLFKLDEAVVRNQYPSLYQWLHDRVFPERIQNKRSVYRERWWVFGEPRRALRLATEALARSIVTIETSKHKPFVFIPKDVLPDHKLYVIASEDASILGVLSSRAHAAWALAAGGTLEDRPTWTNTTCFLPFPFPACSEPQKARIRQLGEDLDAHRKRQQAIHPDLTITGMYNVLEKLRSGEALTDKERTIHEKGLVSVLKQIHDDLDAAVFEAYGWPSTLTEEEILERLVALNAERAEEEKRGLIRWLRPEFQNPGGQTATQTQLAGAGGDDEPEAAGAKEAKPWPKDLPAQVAALREFFQGETSLRSAQEIAAEFEGAKAKDLEPFLRLLTDLGQLLEADVEGRKMWKAL
jgi:hypothetical protein